MTNATFRPKNKSCYKGKMGRLLMSKAGQPCIFQGEVTHPAEACAHGIPVTFAFIKFPNCVIPFQVRPCDVAKDGE